MLKVGVWLQDDYSPAEGGGYSYYDKLVKAIDAYEFPANLQIVFVSRSEKKGLKKEIISLGGIGFFSKLIFKSVKRLTISKIKYRLLSLAFRRENRILKEAGVRLIYYPLQAKQFIPDFPFISTNWDLGHLSTHGFPEMMQNGEFDEREFWYRQILPQALYVFSESESGKQELMNYLHLPEQKVKVVPIFTGNLPSIPVEQQREQLATLGVKEFGYFFYPAQFWAHKNHYNLLLAFKQIVLESPGLKMVLTGSDKGNGAYIKKLTGELGLSGNIVFAGFVSTAMIYSLYTNAAALVLPSFLGPTNMPLLEARELGCPVLCTDHSGHHEMMGEGALYFSPTDINGMAKAMKEVLNPALRSELLRKAEEMKQNSIFTVDEAIARISDYLTELIPVRNTWE